LKVKFEWAFECLCFGSSGVETCFKFMMIDL
jgi:hypothetical protein